MFSFNTAFFHNYKLSEVEIFSSDKGGASRTKEMHGTYIYIYHALYTKILHIVHMTPLVSGNGSFKK